MTSNNSEKHLSLSVLELYIKNDLIPDTNQVTSLVNKTLRFIYFGIINMIILLDVLICLRTILLKNRQQQINS